MLGFATFADVARADLLGATAPATSPVQPALQTASSTTTPALAALPPAPTATSVAPATRNVATSAPTTTAPAPTAHEVASATAHVSNVVNTVPAASRVKTATEPVASTTPTVKDTVSTVGGAASDAVGTVQRSADEPVNAVVGSVQTGATGMLAKTTSIVAPVTGLVTNVVTSSATHAVAVPPSGGLPKPDTAPPTAMEEGQAPSPIAHAATEASSSTGGVAGVMRSLRARPVRPALPSWLPPAALNAPQVPRAHGAGAPPHGPTAPRWPLPGFPTAGLAVGASGGGVVLLFAALLLTLMLAIPNAGRWLRPALALGLRPAFVSPGDRPG